ncbi:hypothetical protein ATCC90586_000211 [Pythium insidiosum]|nr:hypothetical protein ATCC90586_000211 [Pythium insidiosum]
MTAWRALSAFKQEKKHEESSSFGKIVGYLNAFAESNAGSVVAFEHVPQTNIFSRAFLCPKPMQEMLRFCRPQILISILLITSTHGGVVMTATAQDAMGDNVPVAVAVALKENEENWRFFLEQLRSAIPDFSRYVATLVHSRGMDLSNAAASIFPTCAQSDAVDAFISPPNVGGNASSSASSNSLQWLEALCAKAPLMILVGWVSKVASTMYQRFAKYGKMASEYPDEFHALLAQYEAEADQYEVLRVAEHGYEVIERHSGRQRIVDFAKRTCTCGDYDVSRFPCLHVFLAVSHADLMRSEVIPHIFLMSSLKAIYGGRVIPIDVDTVASDNVTIPHPVPKTRGRPRKIQQIQQFSDTKHEKLACSICGVKGHNKRTCKRLLSADAHSAASIVAAAKSDVDSAHFLDGGYEDLPCVLATATSEETSMVDGSSPLAKRRRLDADAKDGESIATEATVV